MAEYWRPIPGYEGIYDISNLAEVRCWYKRKGFPPEWVPHDKPSPMKTCCTYRKSKGVYELTVALAHPEKKKRRVMVKHIMRDVWMEGKRPGLVVECIDKDQSNCSLYNLRYTTMGKVAKRVRKTNRVPVKKMNAKTGEVIEYYRSIAEAARKLYLSPRAVDLRIQNKTVVDGFYLKRER